MAGELRATFGKAKGGGYKVHCGYCHAIIGIYTWTAPATPPKPGPRPVPCPACKRPNRVSAEGPGRK